MIVEKPSEKSFVASTHLPRRGDRSSSLQTLRTLGIVSFPCIVLLAFTRKENTSERINNFLGLCFALYLSVFIFLLLRREKESLNQAWSFTRLSNSTFWKCVYSISVIYLLFLGFVIFQSRRQIMNFLVWYWPYLKTPRPEKVYDTDCSDYKWKAILFDYFALAHLLGWAVKVPIARNFGLLWTLSVGWEITEVFFTHLTRVFSECWWDSLILDILFCNATGIFLGMAVCKLFKVKSLSWKKIIKKDEAVTCHMKHMQVILQLPHLRMVAGIYFLVCLWQISEMNTIYMREMLQLTLGHPLTLSRVIITGLSAIPAISQFHTYLTDPKCKTLGANMWIFITIILIELLIILKFGLINLFTWNNFMWPILWAIFMLPYSAISYYAIVKFGGRGSEEPGSEELNSWTINI